MRGCDKDLNLVGYIAKILFTVSWAILSVELAFGVQSNPYNYSPKAISGRTFHLDLQGRNASKMQYGSSYKEKISPALMF